MCVARQDRRAEPLTAPGRHLELPCCRVVIGQLDVIRFVRAIKRQSMLSPPVTTGLEARTTMNNDEWHKANFIDDVVQCSDQTCDVCLRWRAMCVAEPRVETGRSAAPRMELPF